MKCTTLWFALTLACAACPACPAVGADNPDSGAGRTTRLNQVLDDWHLAAASADEDRYFNHFAPDAVFLGTDAAERWTRDEFRLWARPYFAKGKAWNFKAAKRHVVIARDGLTAWFDEVLDTPNLGLARGTGVLIWDGKTWKIAHYNLSVPIPNDVFPDVKKLIDNAARSPKPRKEP
jgi:hypothetical protein